MTTPIPTKPLRNKQRGAALIILGLILVLGLITLFSFNLERKTPQLEADRKTALALAQAKEALLGYAAKDENRPGSLPCADINDDGEPTFGADFSCSPNVIGRLPWKQLDVPDLRDGSGERFWYAVSSDFRSSYNVARNSNTAGQITIRNSMGVIVSDAGATPSTGVVAVIIAPGRALIRQGAAATQNRSCAGGGGCAEESVCLSPYQSVAKCNPVNYLDVLEGVEDNANFSPPSNGFIHGPIQEITGKAIVNDRMITITASELFSVVTFRMARELSFAAFVGGAIPSDGSGEIAGISNKPTIWVSNNWDAAVDGPPVYATGPAKVFGSTITLKFLKCNITYTITGPGVVTKNVPAC